MAFLKKDNVIFYHPLDNTVEFTQNDSWVGSGTFSPAKINNGFQSVGIDDPSFNTSPFILESGGTLNGMALYSHGMALIDDTHFVVVYRTDENGGSTKDRIVAAEIIGTTINYGVAVEIDTGVAVSDTNPFRIAHLGSGECILVKTSGSNIQAMHITVNGTVVTTGQAISLGGGFDPDITALSGNKALVSKAVFAGNFPDRDGFVTVLSLNGSTLSAGADSIFAGPNNTGVPHAIMTTMPSNDVILTWTEEELDVLRASVVTIVGTIATVGPQFTISSGTLIKDSSVRHSVIPVSGSNFVIGFSKNLGAFSRGPYFVVGQQAGTTLTFGPELKWDNEPGGVPTVSMEKLSDSRILVNRGSQTPGIGSVIKIVNVSGTTISSFGFNVDGHLSENNFGGEILLNNSNDIIIGGSDTAKDIETNIGALTTEDQITSTSGVYPSVSGTDRIVYSMWTIKPTLSQSTVDIERGYRIKLSPSTIQFVSGTPLSGIPTWSGAGIDTLMSGLNNGTDHFITLDFEHQSLGNWRLNTSLDGSGFIDQGINTSGTQNILTTDTQPLLKVGLCETGRWIDEAILWAGDKTQLIKFTSQELLDLYNLAQLRNLTMDQFTFTTKTLPLFTSSLAVINYNNILYTQGPLLINKPLQYFIEGSGITTSGSSVDILFDEFIKSADFTPQIIGLFNTNPTSVTIRVWNLNKNPVQEITLIDNTCFEIGSTGRWRWSTINLPEALRSVGHYEYVMTSDLMETFKGEFVFKQLNNANFIIPSNINKFVI